MTATITPRTFATEQEFTDAVIELCALRGLLVHHCRPARTAKGWVTPIQGNKGFTDLVIVGSRGVLFRELKSESGRVSPEQDVWIGRLARAGSNVAVWRPADWPHLIHAEIKAIR